MILLVGQYYKDLVNNFKQHGIDYHILKDNARYSKEGPHTTLADFSSLESTLAAVDDLPVKPDLALSTYEQYIVAATRINAHLGNTHALSTESAIKCTDKTRMREAFSTAPQKISPAYAEVATLDAARDFANTHNFPLILKPANLAKSLLVSRCDNIEELERAFTDSMQRAIGLYKKYTNNLTPKFILEEFMEGPIFSVDAFIDADGTPFVLNEIVDYQTAKDIGFDDTFHYSRNLPSTLPPEEQAALRECARLGIVALGMRSCPAHVEIILTKDGPRIVEIGARNGGYRPRMHGWANGIDILDAAIKAYQGKAGPITALKNEYCSVLEVFPKNSGKFVRIKHEEALKALPSFRYYNLTRSPDEIVGKAIEGHKAVAIIILHNADAVQFKKDLQFVHDNVEVITASS